jgi:hypothetical protein
MRRPFAIQLEEPTGVPLKWLFEIQINLEPNAKILYRHPYWVAPLEDAKQVQQLAVPQDNGWITDSHSPLAAPNLFLKNVDRSMYLCADYRALNSITSNDR